ncbi:Uncharacterised protein [Tatumella ptyseos]|uniref:Secreted protein n=1 Tax=Tatumella ptyseos TaxID=82987 RepID=A0A2X5RC94_9GAMM|nr:Uncharacterised protein [Tatumella ptyseos]
MKRGLAWTVRSLLLLPVILPAKPKVTSQQRAVTGLPPRCKTGNDSGKSAVKLRGRITQGKRNDTVKEGHVLAAVRGDVHRGCSVYGGKGASSLPLPAFIACRVRGGKWPLSGAGLCSLCKPPITPPSVLTDFMLFLLLFREVCAIR